MNRWEGPQTILGHAFCVVGGMMGIWIGLIKGGLNAAQGRSFWEGVMEVFLPAYEKAGEFGDKHSGKTVSRVVSQVISGLLLGVGFDIGHFGDRD